MAPRYYALTTTPSMKRMLTYDSRDFRYHGVQSDGTAIQIDGDAYAEARTERVEDSGFGGGFFIPDTVFHAANLETSDPDGWSWDMAGWIPAGE